MMAEPDLTAASTRAKEKLARQVRRFEQLVSEHGDQLRRIELLLEEIGAEGERPIAVSPPMASRTSSPARQ